MTRPTIGLAMIVRNEARIIERCLESVRGFIDHWTIVDTGSRDGTPGIIRECLHGIPGVVYDRPWWKSTATGSRIIARGRMR